MKFFDSYQIYLAESCSAKQLRKEYKRSERDLKRVAKTGDVEYLAGVMKEHGDFEYAMLYQKTPEFKKNRGCR